MLSFEQFALLLFLFLLLLSTLWLLLLYGGTVSYFNSIKPTKNVTVITAV